VGYVAHEIGRITKHGKDTSPADPGDLGQNRWLPVGTWLAVSG